MYIQLKKVLPTCYYSKNKIKLGYTISYFFRYGPIALVNFKKNNKNILSKKVKLHIF